MPVPFLSLIAAPLELVIWIAEQPWGPLVGPAMVGLAAIAAGVFTIRGARR